MPERNHPAQPPTTPPSPDPAPLPDPAPPLHVLASGETITVDGSTIADPETGRPVPAAVLRLPSWRLRELAAALTLWTRTLDLITTAGADLPFEHELAAALSHTAQTVAPTAPTTTTTATTTTTT